MTDELAPFERQAVGVKNPYNKEALQAMADSTPARICTGREGPRPPIEAWLSFRWDEAMAKDAVFGMVSDEYLEKCGLAIRVQTTCVDKHDYLGHPEKGGVFTDEAVQILREKCVANPQVQIAVSEGLSFLAVEENVEILLPALLDGLKAEGIKAGTPFFVDYGRVRLLNDIGRVLSPDVAVILIGERPGLVTQTSLSAYLAYKPKPKDTDANRNCISNIYKKGLSPLEAAPVIVDMVKGMLKQKVSGVGLKL